MTKKNILITLGEDIIARNIFFTEFWSEFKRLTAESNIILVVKPEKLESYKQIFESDSVKVVAFRSSDNKVGIDNFILTLARSAINTHTNLWSKMRSYLRGDSGFFETYIKRFLTATLGRFDFYKKIIRRLILLLPADDSASDIFKNNNVNIFVPLSLTNFEFDVVLARASRKMKIPIIGMVRSWDNLSSHGLLRVVPDVFIVQNQFLKEMAIKFQAITLKDTQTFISGLPHYDEYMKKESIIDSKEVFFKKFNLDQNKKTVLYCGMGDSLFKNEADIIDILEEMVVEGKIQENIQILYSPHPKFLSSLEKLKGKKYIIKSPEITYTDPGKNSWESQLENNRRLINLIYHCDVIVMGASSMVIDARVLNRPVVCVAFDGVNPNVPYFESVKRFYDCYTHFEELMKTESFQIAYSQEQLAEMINNNINHPRLGESAREEMIRRFVAPFDGESGKRLAQLINNSIKSIL